MNVPADRVVSFFVEGRKKYTRYGYATFYYVVARLVGSGRAEVLKTVKPLERAVAVQRALADGLRRLHAQRERRDAEGTGAADTDGI